MIGKERVEPVSDWEAPPCSSGEAPTPPWHDPAHWSSTLSASSEPRSRVHRRYPCIIREAMTKSIMLYSDSLAKPGLLQPPLWRWLGTRHIQTGWCSSRPVLIHGLWPGDEKGFCFSKIKLHHKSSASHPGTRIPVPLRISCLLNHTFAAHLLFSCDSYGSLHSSY